MHSSTRIKKRSNLDGRCDVDVLLEGEEGKEDGKRRRRKREEEESGWGEGKERREEEEEGEGTGKEKRCYMPDTYIIN